MTCSKVPNAAGSSAASLHPVTEVNVSNALISGLRSPTQLQFLLSAAGLTKVSHLTSPVMSPHVSHYAITPTTGQQAALAGSNCCSFPALKSRESKVLKVKMLPANSNHALHLFCCVLVKTALFQEGFTSWAPGHFDFFLSQQNSGEVWSVLDSLGNSDANV